MNKILKNLLISLILFILIGCVKSEKSKWAQSNLPMEGDSYLYQAEMNDEASRWARGDTSRRRYFIYGYIDQPQDVYAIQQMYERLEFFTHIEFIKEMSDQDDYECFIDKMLQKNYTPSVRIKPKREPF